MSRHGRAKVRAQLQFMEACEGLEDQLDAAKQAHAEAPTLETLAAKRQAMATMHETRAWIRAVDGIKKAERDVAAYASATDAKSVRRYEQAQRDLERLPREFGPLIAAMEELSGTTVSGQPPADPVPDGSVQVTPPPVRSRTRVTRPGGGS